ncbi:MAG TPA: J domain-containing protein [Hyphomicrobium sp.]|nr:J domain-containing protein [Hyphomicrobium sp.]
MMSSDEAIREAISVLKVPSQVRRLRTAPLPEGTPLLLAIAAGDPDAEKVAMSLTGRPVELLREAAGFFIEQILLFPDADSYRMLGADKTSMSQELRNHMVLLMRWLHPDMDQTGEREHLAVRVLSAWEDLKSTERRSAYDAAHAASDAQNRARAPSAGSKKQPSHISRRPVVHGARPPAGGWLRSIVGMFSSR